MLWFVLLSLAAAPEQDTAAAIMTKVAENTGSAFDARRQFVYRQKVGAAMMRSNGERVCSEAREYQATPQASSTEKTLISFAGEYRQGKRMAAYPKPEAMGKNSNGDCGNLQDFTDDLVDAKNSRDGVPKNLFPLRNEDFAFYKFSLRGEAVLRGRPAYDILFEPLETKGVWIHVGGDEEDTCHQWKGELWIDKEDLQPVRIDTHLAKAVPWGVRVFAGIDARQYGFSINYRRVAENVWFPISYGTEFRMTIFWAYKRTVTLSIENNDFRRTDASSTIHFDGIEQ